MVSFELKMLPIFHFLSLEISTTEALLTDVSRFSVPKNFGLALQKHSHYVKCMPQFL